MIREGTHVLQNLLRRGRNGDRAAEATTEATPMRAQPAKIGLALGGGAARGFAHIGVLKVLRERGIKPDVVVGTSMGAVAAACHACEELETFESWARSLTRRGVIGYLDLSLGGSGLIGGKRLNAKLEETFGEKLIEDLPCPFAAVATELDSGHEIWLTRGRLADALRASYALPGIFPPVRLGGRWLVDGALVNPVPVSAARALGARIVIAVNLNADLFGRGALIPSHGSDADDERLRQALRARPRNGLRAMFSPERLVMRQLVGRSGRPGIPAVMINAFNVMQDRVTRSRLAGDPPDVLISPRLGGVGLFDFHRAGEAIETGTQAAERALEDVVEALAALG
jgi:NTE family protein